MKHYFISCEYLNSQGILMQYSAIMDLPLVPRSSDSPDIKDAILAGIDDIQDGTFNMTQLNFLGESTD